MKEKVEDSTIQHLNWSKWILSLAVVAVLLLGMSGCGNQGPSLKGRWEMFVEKIKVRWDRNMEWMTLLTAWSWISRNVLLIRRWKSYQAERKVMVLWIFPLCPASIVTI